MLVSGLIWESQNFPKQPISFSRWFIQNHIPYLNQYSSYREYGNMSSVMNMQIRPVNRATFAFLSFPHSIYFKLQKVN
jgi:hypothetical protein